MKLGFTAQAARDLIDIADYIRERNLRQTPLAHLVKTPRKSHIDWWAPGCVLGPVGFLALWGKMARIANRKRAYFAGATPKQVDRELRTFSRAARLLSSDHPRLINEHPKEWVGLYDGKVHATAKSFAALVSKLKKQGLPPNEAIIRYIDTSGRMLIL
jgi:hypothetical protein